MNSFEVLGQSADMDEPSEQEVEFLQLKALNADVKVNLSEKPFDTQNYPASVSLLACSSKFGYFVAGTPTGFAFGQLKDLRATFNKSDKGATTSFKEKIDIPVPQGAVHHLRLSATQEHIIAGLADGTILVFSAKSIATKASLPLKSISAGSPILDLRPNPEEKPDVIAVLLTNNTCQYMSLSSGSVLARIPDNDITAICWSPKGKQITVGTKKGYMIQYDLEGNRKTAVEPPAAMTQQGGETTDRYIQNLLWIENNIFLAIYAVPPSPDDEQAPHMYDGYIITRQPKSTIKNYTRLTDICMPFGQQNRGAQYYMEVIKGLGEEAPHVVLVASAPSSAIGVVGQSKSGDWHVWELDDTSRANLPLSEQTDMDTSPFGLALDFSSTERLEPLDPSEPENFVNPVPILYFLNDEDNMGAFHCLNVEAAKRNESYAGQVQPQSLSGATPAPAAAATPFAAATSSFGSTASAAFGSATTAPFTSTTSVPVTSAAATSSFTTPSSFTAAETKPSAFTSTFGGPGGLGAAKPAITPSTQPSTTASTFSGFGTQAQTSAPTFSFDSPTPATSTTPASTGINWGSAQSKASPNAGKLNFNLGDNKPQPSPTFGSATSSVKSPPSKETGSLAFTATKSPLSSPAMATSFAPATSQAAKGASPLQTPSSFASSPKSDISTASSVKAPITFGGPAPSILSQAPPAETPAATPAPAPSRMEEEQKSALKGMAREFESTYLTLNTELSKLHSIAEASEKLAAKDRQSTPSLNTLDALQRVDEWKLSDLKTQINLTRQLLEKMKGLQKEGESLKSHMSKLDREAVKNSHKQYEIKKFLEAKSDPAKLESTMADHLGPEAQDTLKKLEEATMKVNDKFKAAEESAEQAKKNLLRNQKAYRGLSSPSLYTIHRTIREVRNGLFVHNIELDEIESRLNSLVLDEEKPRPRAYSSRFSFDEYIGEQPPLMQAKQAERKFQLPKASRQAIDAASQVLAQESFLFRLSKSAAARQPLVHKIAARPVVQRKEHQPLDASSLGIDLSALDVSDISTPRSLSTPIKESEVLHLSDTEPEDEEEEEEEEEDDEEEEEQEEEQQEEVRPEVKAPESKPFSGFGEFKGFTSQQASPSLHQFGSPKVTTPKFGSPQIGSPRFGTSSAQKTVPPFNFQLEGESFASGVKSPLFGAATQSGTAKFTATSVAKPATTLTEPVKTEAVSDDAAVDTPTRATENEAAKAEGAMAEQVKAEEVKTEEANADEIKADQAKSGDVKAEEPQTEEVNAEVVKAESVTAEEPVEAPTANEPKAKEPNLEATKTEEPKMEASKAEESQAEKEVAPSEPAAPTPEQAPKGEMASDAKADAVTNAPTDTDKTADTPVSQSPWSSVTSSFVDTEAKATSGQQPSTQSPIESDGESSFDVVEQDEYRDYELKMDDLGISLSEPATGRQPQSPTESTPNEPFGSAISTSAAPLPKPAFGSTSLAFGGATTTSAPAFGFSPAPASVFGSTTTPAPAFGSSASSAPAAGGTMSAPAFGSSTAGSAFGGTTTSTSGFGSTASAPAFGSSEPAPAFGSTGFGGSTAPAFGSTTAFGAQAAPSFGSTTPFGSQTQAPQPGFGSSAPFGSATPAFGSTTSFGAASNAPSFGSTTSLGSAAPAFGATSSLGGAPGFGATSSLGNSAFSRGFGTAPKSTFGSSTSFSSTGGFAAAAQQAQQGTGFGALAQQGQNVFDNQPSTAGAFGTAAPFGQQQQQQQQQNRPFGSNPAFTQFRG